MTLMALTRDAAAKLPFHYYRPVNTREEFRHQPQEADGGMCVCLRPYKKCERLVPFPCGHRMHRKCAIQWLTRHGYPCPYCVKEQSVMTGKKK